MVVSLPALMALILLVGMAAMSFCHVLTAASKTILPTSVGSNSTSLLLPKRFSLLRLPFPPTPPCIHAPQYHVTLMLAEYDALHHSTSINVSFSTSLASLPAPSTSGTSALLASSSPSWIIDSGASSHMTRTSSLLSSYHRTPYHPPSTIAYGRPCSVQGRVTPSLSLRQILYVPGFPVNLLSISAITRALPHTFTFFPFIVFSRICTPDRGLVWAVRMSKTSMS